MKIIGRYFILEYKNCLKAIVKSAIGMFLVLVLLVLGIIAVSVGIQQEQILPKLKVAMVVSQDERMLDMAVKFVASMDSVESICEFCYMEETEAREGLETGELQAVIILPVNFYEDIDNGLNTPAEVLISNKNGVNSAVFGELLTAGVSYLQTAEAGVYATLDVARAESAQMKTSKIGNYLAEYYMRTLFDRMNIYEEKVVSPLGTMEYSQYIVVTVLLLILLVSGSNFSVLYQEKEKIIEQKLKSSGMNCIICTFVKVLIMTMCLWGLWVLSYLVMCIVSATLEMELLWWDTAVLLSAYLVCMSIAAFFHLIYELSGKAANGALLLLFINIGMVLCSGIIVPSVYLGKAAALGEFLPVSLWSNYMQNVLYDIVSIEQTGILILVTGIEVIAGAVAVWKNM